MLEARRNKNVTYSPVPRPRIGEGAQIDAKYDFVVYLFMEDASYYSAILITEFVVATYQVLMVQEPRICFNEDCTEEVKRTWSKGNFQFWRLQKKRAKPSLHKGKLNEDDCYLPPELGMQGYIEFDVIDESVIECSGVCMSGDAIICGNDLYGMLAKVRDEDLDQFEYVSVNKLKSLAGIADEQRKPEDTEDEDSMLTYDLPERERRNETISVRKSSSASSSFSLVLFGVELVSTVLVRCYYRIG
ncbi:hypothetical protein Trydic_g9263 [Trypoxylus dichotomus]